MVGHQYVQKVAQTLEVCTVEGLLLAAKTMLSRYRWDEKSLWVDKEQQCLKYGDDAVLKVGAADGEMTISYGNGWGD